MFIRLMHVMRQISMHLVGIDVPTFDDVIVHGQSPDTDEFVQVYGWLKWMKSVLPHTYLYLTTSAHTVPKEFCQQRSFLRS